MVKAATMAGNRGGGRTRPGDEIDPGLPLTHPAMMIPIIGLIIMGSMALIACFCKCLPSLVPNKLKWFGKRSVDTDLELQLGRRNRRRQSESSNISHGRRTPSFNSADRQQPRREMRPKSRTLEVEVSSNGQLAPSAPPYTPNADIGSSIGWTLNNSSHNSRNGKNKKSKPLPYDCYLPPPSYESVIKISPPEQLV